MRPTVYGLDGVVRQTVSLLLKVWAKSRGKAGKCSKKSRMSGRHSWPGVCITEGRHCPLSDQKSHFSSLSVAHFIPVGEISPLEMIKPNAKKRAIFFPALCSVGRNPALPRHPKLHCTPMKIVECMVHFTGSQWI